MPFVFRTDTFPPLDQITEIEQIVIIDQTGPAVALGLPGGLVCLVGEFLKGSFDFTLVGSSGEVRSLYGTLSEVLSQDSLDPATAVQDGSGVAFDGNGLLQLKNKTFRRLGIVRVDTEARTTDPDGATKGVLDVEVTFNAADITGGVTNKDILVPAGTRFADNTIDLATVVVATSEDVTIPKGTAAGAPFTINPHCFYVKGVAALAAAIDTVIDSAVPGVLSTITGVDNATALYPPGTGATLADRIASAYIGTPNNLGAIAKSLPGGAVGTDDIVGIWAARNTSAIRAELWANAKAASQNGRGRVACVSADHAAGSSAANASAAKAAALALSAAEFPGVDGDRAFVCFPYGKVFSTELGSRNVDVSPDGFRAMEVSIQPAEYQTSVPNDEMQVLQELEDAFKLNPLVRDDYVNLKAAGVGALIRDRSTGWQFQSGVTAVDPATYPTRVADNRRRMADFIQDQLVALAARYNKFPGTTERVDSLVGEIDTFLSSLESAQNPSQQRIEGYEIDADDLNTAQLIAAGVRVILVKVQMLGDLNDIVFQTEIGPTVTITQVA